MQCIGRKMSRDDLVVSLLDAKTLQIGDVNYQPSLQQFYDAWGRLTTINQRSIAKAAIGFDEIGEVLIELNQDRVSRLVPSNVVQMLGLEKVARVVYLGKMLKLCTDEARTLFAEAVLSRSVTQQKQLKQLNDIILHDAGHLQRLADQLQVDGDGKREILKNVIAFGMQTKLIETEMRDLLGNVKSPAVYSLADPKMALQAVQELNRMDHEYGDDDKATSSIEQQHERIARLKGEMERNSRSQANELGGVARLIKQEEVE